MSKRNTSKTSSIVGPVMILASALFLATGLTACVGTDSGDDTDTSTNTSTDPTDILPENMIDDLEDGDDVIMDQGDRSGDWYVYNDATAGGQQTPSEDAVLPEAGGPEGSAYAFHSTGGGFTEWGAGFGFDLNLGESDGGASELKNPYDASAFTGVAFMAKGNAAVRVALAMPAVIAMENGGTCDPAGGDCDDTHGLSFDLTEEWVQYKVPFADVAQEGWGQAVTFDPALIASIMFDIGPSIDFEVWVDEIGFY